MSGKSDLEVGMFGPAYQLTADGWVQMRPTMTRAEFVQNLSEMVKNCPNIKFFTPKTTENWSKTSATTFSEQDLSAELSDE
jgi:hypothetical protein